MNGWAQFCGCECGWVCADVMCCICLVRSVSMRISTHFCVQVDFLVGMRRYTCDTCTYDVDILLSQAFVGYVTTVQVQTRDIYNNNLISGGASVASRIQGRVTIKSNGDGDDASNNKDSDNDSSDTSLSDSSSDLVFAYSKQGIYTATYRSDILGSGSISITFDSVPIEGSPFPLTCVNAVVAAEFTDVEDEISYAQAGARTHIIVTTRDASGNEVCTNH